MPGKINTRTKKIAILLVIGVCAVIAVIVGYRFRGAEKTADITPMENIEKTPVKEQPADEKRVAAEVKEAEQIRIPIKPPAIIDYDGLKENKKLSALMDKRKAKYGIKKGVDIIVKPDESIRIGDITIPMQEILDKIRLKKGGFIERELTSKPAAKPTNGTIKTDAEALTEELKENKFLLSKKEKPGPPKIIRKKVIRIIETQLTRPPEKTDSRKTAAIQSPVPRVEAITEEKSEGERPKQKSEAPKSETPDDPKTGSMAYGSLKQAEATGAERKRANGRAVSPAARDTSRQTQNQTGTIDLEQQKPGDRPGLPEYRSPKYRSPKYRSPKYRSNGRPGNKERNILAFKEYKKTIDEIDAIKKRLPRGTPQKHKRLRDELSELTVQKEKLADTLKALASAENQREKKDIEAYGIYVVKANDNLWNVHFSFLKEYFEFKGIDLEPFSDEPDRRGRSSGVGRLLKFSEHMVFIYNVKERKLSLDLDLIHQANKIVIFNMGDVFSILDNIDYSQIDHIRFDGDTLWMLSE